jgi:hypothetical protein
MRPAANLRTHSVSGEWARPVQELDAIVRLGEPPPCDVTVGDNEALGLVAIEIGPVVPRTGLPRRERHVGTGAARLAGLQ